MGCNAVRLLPCQQVAGGRWVDVSRDWSAACAAVRELGELDAAAAEIEWAMSEGKPRIEGVADTEELIRCIDTRLQVMLLFGGE